MKNHMIFIGLALLAVGFIVFGPYATPVENASLSHMTFFVTWYDAGKVVLEGLHGVKHVSIGYRGFREVNSATYDPQVISPQQMIDALKSARIFIGTAEE